MDKIPLHAILLQSWPEAVAIMSLGLVLIREKPRMKRLILAGLIYAFASFFIRRLPILFGVHTLLHIPVMIVLLVLLLRLSWRSAGVAALIAVASLIIVEAVLIGIVVPVLGISLSEVLADPYLRVLFPLPHIVLIGLLAFFFWKRRIFLLDMSVIRGR